MDTKLPKAALVVAAVIGDQMPDPRLILAVRRAYPLVEAGLWEFPGGKVEPGESPEEAVRRELAEELGVAVEVATELQHPHGGHWEVRPGLPIRAWFATTKDPVVPGVAHDELRWLTRAELSDVPWLPVDAEIAEAVAPYLQGDS